MVPRASQTVVTPLPAGDLVAMAQCIAIDAESFPFASIQFNRNARGAPLWIARESAGPRVLGFVATRRRHTDLDIEALAVTPEAQRRGIGRSLLRTAIAHARRSRLKTVSLHVWEGNANAIRMYEREGFVILRAQPGYYRPGAFDAAGNAYEMVLQLKV
jgi:ribosomal protein S18 acetylase RimI-like enzyme